VRLKWDDALGWQPEGAREVPALQLQADDLIEVERALWRVAGVRSVPVAEWDDRDREHYDRNTALTAPGGRRVPPETWALRPVYVTVRPARGGPGSRLRCQPYMYRQAAVRVIPAHHPVCAECGELYPCRHLEIDRLADAGLAELENLEAILPGCCWHCREPVTERQKSITYPGDNLLLPGAPPPLFHLRNSAPHYCATAAIGYEKSWVKAGPGRRPALHCPGRLTKHIDGTECDAGDQCPGPTANHLSQRSHQGNAAWLRDCERCATACRRQGITVPAAPQTSTGRNDR